MENQWWKAIGYDRRPAEIFGENVRLARGGASQRFLADVVNRIAPELSFHQSTIAKIEGGQRPTSVDEIAVLAEVLDVSPASLLPSDEAIASARALRARHDRLQREVEEMEGVLDAMRQMRDEAAEKLQKAAKARPVPPKPVVRKASR